MVVRVPMVRLGLVAPHPWLGLQGRLSARVAAALLAAFFAAGLPASEVEIRLKPVPRLLLDEPATVSVVARPALDTGRGAPAKPIKLRTQVPGRVVLTLPAAGAWRLSMDGSGLWMPETVVTPAEPRREITLKVWPTAVLTGRVKVPGGHDVPESLRVTFQSAPDAPGNPAIPAGSVVCPITNGRWSCAVPAGVLDLKLKAGGFISHFRWGMTVEPPGTTELSDLDLRPGASLIGWVELAGRGSLKSRINVELGGLSAVVRPDEESGAVEDRRKFRQAATEPNERGFFSFEDVEPGAYEVVARCDGFAPARSGPIKVFENVETELTRRLILQPPQDIELYLAPPADPQGEPWQVEIFARDLGTPPPSLGKTVAREGGLWERTGLAPGSYLVRIGDSEGSAWHQEDVEVASFPVSRYVEIPVIPVRGELLLGEEPLQARLEFWDRTSLIRMESDEEGRFEGYLPKEGGWRLRLLGISPRFVKRLNRIEIRRRPGKNVAEIEIVLPDNRVTGVVVDELGMPVYPGMVHGVVLRADGLLAAPVDSEGGFTFRGLEPGTIRLTAEAEGSRFSDEMIVEVIEDLKPAPIELVVREMMTIRGRIVSQGAGMPEVHIQAWPAQVPFAIVQPIGTDVEGRFEVKVPKVTTELAVNVLARGFALRMLRVPVSPERELTIPVHSISGDLVLEFETPPETDYRLGTSVVVLHNGSRIGLAMARNWARLSGPTVDSSASKVVIPDLEPGVYTVCAVKSPDLPRVILSHGADDQCVGGYLAPQGELALKVPKVSP